MHLQKAVGPFHLLVVKDERIGLEPPPPAAPEPLSEHPSWKRWAAWRLLLPKP